MSKRNPKTNKQMPSSLVFLAVNEVTAGYKLAAKLIGIFSTNME